MNWDQEDKRCPRSAKRISPLDERPTPKRSLFQRALVDALAATCDLRPMAAKRKKEKVTPAQIEREAKRAAQVAAGALDGRFREKVVKSGKSYKRKPKHPDGEA